MGIKLLLLLTFVSYCSATVKLQEVFSWNALDFAYPDQQARRNAIRSGEFIQENILPVGVEKWKNKLFVTAPRWRAGIPATLSYIPLDAPYDPSPKLIPYPSWEANELGNCASGLTTVYRVKADQCDRLWVLDVGTFGGNPNTTNVCPYSLNVYDLNTDKRIRKYVFRPEDIVPSTFIANIALDIGRDCDDAFAYFSDELGYGLIAYSWEQNKSWRFSHSYFFPDPLRGDFNIAGLNFQWGSEGVFGITASPIGSDGYRTLYFSSIASHTQFSVSTRILRNESKVEGSYHDFKVVGNRGPNGHTTAHVMTESGIKLFSLIDQNAIGCWYSGKSYKPQNIAIVDKDDVGLIFPSDVKIVDEKDVWVLSDRMSTFLESEYGLDYGEINFRIFTAPLDELVSGTVCEPPFRLAPAPLAVPKQLNYYDSRLGKTPPPPVYYQPSQPNYQPAQPNYQASQPNYQAPQPNYQSPQLPQLAYNLRPAKVTSYINFPALQAVPVKVDNNDIHSHQWWVKPKQYDVYEKV